MKLNIGGEEKKEGWKILNIQKKPHVDFIGDISDLGQFEDNSIDESFFFDSIKFENNIFKFEIPSKFYYKFKTYSDKFILFNGTSLCGSHHSKGP